MELGGYGFEKSELKKIAEEIYECRGKKQQLELELSSEEFHRSYIPKRENMTGTRIAANLPIVIVFTLGLIIFVSMIFLCIIADSESKVGFAFPMLGSGLFVVFTARIGFPLLREELQMLVLFSYSTKPERAMRFAKKYGINTFQDDKLRCDERITNLKAQIDVIDKQITDLENRQDELINEAKKRENVLRKYNIIRDEQSTKNASADKMTLTLKKDDMEGIDISELYEYYDKEESFTRYIMKDLDFKLNSIDKEIGMIDDQFEQVKKRIIIFLCVYVLAIVIQGAVPGIGGGILGGLCLIVGLVAMFAIERACRGPVLRYLVEKESPLVSEYCFKNDIVPAKYRRQKIVAMIKQNEDMLNDIKKRKQSLENDG